MTNDWIEHNGGPQPVDDDVWVEVSTAKRAALPFHTQTRFVADWRIIRRYRILNQHLIDAARLDGIRLGLEAAEEAALKAEDTLDNEWRAGGRYDSYLEGRSDGMGEAADLIRTLNPESIARDVQTSSHQEKCDDLHIAREAQDMGSEKEAKDD